MTGAVTSGIVLILVLTAVIGAMYLVPHRLVTIGDRDVRWLLGSPPTSPAAALLARRYLIRVRLNRRLGALAGVALAVIVGLARTSSIKVGIDGGSPASDLLFSGLAGLLAGSVLAEVYRIRPSTTRRAADLTPRAADDEARGVHPVTAVLVVATIALVVREPGARSIALAAAAVVTLALQWRVVRAIAGRRRPALPDDLRAADDRVRSFGARRFTVESLAGAVLVLGWQVAGQRWAVPDAIVSTGLLGLVALVVVLLRRSRPYPPRRFP